MSTAQVKELDDEDYSYQAMQEPLYRLETGNYEYRCQATHCTGTSVRWQAAEVPLVYLPLSTSSCPPPLVHLPSPPG